MTQEYTRLPYAFALQSGAILSGDRTSGITLLHRDKMSLATLLECQRLSGRIDAFKQLSASDFEQALAETYKSSASRAADLAAESNSDLAALADDAAASEDILDDRANAPVVQLINALLSDPREGIRHSYRAARDTACHTLQDRRCASRPYRTETQPGAHAREPHQGNGRSGYRGEAQAS